MLTVVSHILDSYLMKEAANFNSMSTENGETVSIL